MTKNISSIHNCYGCGVCAIACGKKIIDFTLNEDGFYEPHINNPDKCTDCGLCIDVCAFSHNDLSLQNQPVHSYAAWSREPAVRRKCSSGGVGFEIGRFLLGQGYKVCGVRYNAEKGIAEHYIAATVEELIQSIGSKYIQSYTVDGFKAINRKEKYLVTGTPCQIDSFRRYIQRFHCEDNFVLMDFFCHGVPSMLAWKKYLGMVEKITGKATYVSWRNKFTGWHDSWAMSIDGEKTGEKVDWHDSYNMLIKEKKGFYNSRLSEGDIFYQLFLGDFCSNPACRLQCKYKYNKSSADIRIGDLWGETYKTNEDGVNAIIIFTGKGKATLAQTNCIFIEHPFTIVAEGQLKKNCGKAHLSYLTSILLHTNKDIKIPLKIIFFLEKALNIPKRIINKIIKTVTRS